MLVFSKAAVAAEALKTSRLPSSGLPGKRDDQGCLQLIAGSPTSLAERHSSPVPSAGWVRRDKTELLLKVGGVSSQSLPSSLSISSVLTAPPLADPKLPLPSQRTGTHTHRHTHGTHPRPIHTVTPHTTHRHPHMCMYPHPPTYRHMHSQASTHVYTPSYPCVCKHTYA